MPLDQSRSEASHLAGTPLPTLAGVNVLLMGGAGTGKTHSLSTIAKAGIELFYLGLEPGLESLLGAWKDVGQEIPENVHWHTLKRADASFKTMMQSAKLINTMSLDSLAKMSDPDKSKYNQFVALLEALNDFPDDRTGKKYGDVSSWKPNRCLAIDGLTGLGLCAMSLVIGGKAVKSQSDWGIAQDQIERLLRQLCDGCACHFVLLSHVERETDLINGGIRIFPQTLGKALPPKLSPMFSDVVLAVRQGREWSWDTANGQADLKTRNLEIKAGLPPDFGAIFAKWKARGGVIG